ncbi:MAG: rhombosortase [Granulosicoccaceae bacterium]
MFKHYFLPLVIVLISAALEWGGLTEALQYDREAIQHGAYWRLLSGNLVHLGSNHLLLNAAGFALVAALVWRYYTQLEWLLIFTVCGLAVGVGLFFLVPELRWYVGLSGVLHGLLLAGACVEIQRYPQSGWPLLLLVVAKLIYEQVTGPMPGSEWAAGGSVVVQSHLYGGAAGLLMGWWLGFRNRNVAQND